MSSSRAQIHAHLASDDLGQASINRLLGGGPNPTLGDLLKEGIAVLRTR